jgi:hypothetical protein
MASKSWLQSHGFKVMAQSYGFDGFFVRHGDGRKASASDGFILFGLDSIFIRNHTVYTDGRPNGTRLGVTVGNKIWSKWPQNGPGREFFT